MPDRGELRRLFLFESFTDEQLDWLVDRGDVVAIPAGAAIHVAGRPAAHLFVLLEGSLQLSRDIAGEEVVITTTDQVGAYTGAVRAFVHDAAPDYETTAVAVGHCRLFRLAAADFSELMHTWFAMATHLLDGLYVGIGRTQDRLREREKLLALGSLSAKLTHELNNPAAAAARAAEQLRGRIGQLRAKLQVLAEGRVDPAKMATLIALGEDAVRRAAQAPRRSALEERAAEDDVTGWLEGRGVDGAWMLAPAFVAAGLGTGWLAEVAAAVGGDAELQPSLSWLAGTLETEALLDEVEEATGRIASLVAAARQYSHADRAPTAAVDLVEGLESTLTLMGHKLAGITIIRDLDPDVGPVVVRPAELNQVWTNLLGNAADALEGAGTITVRTRRDGDVAVVDIADDGPGIPDDVLPHIYEPFFTTKARGGGTGVGLEISRRIVEQVHAGSLSVATGPAGTTFTVRLPVDGAG